MLLVLIHQSWRQLRSQRLVSQCSPIRASMRAAIMCAAQREMSVHFTSMHVFIWLHSPSGYPRRSTQDQSPAVNSEIFDHSSPYIDTFIVALSWDQSFITSHSLWTRPPANIAKNIYTHNMLLLTLFTSLCLIFPYVVADRAITEWTAMGDSYASGVGAGAQPADDTNRCFRFPNAYPAVMQSGDGSIQPNPVKWNNVACSGNTA